MNSFHRLKTSWFGCRWISILQERPKWFCRGTSKGLHRYRTIFALHIEKTMSELINLSIKQAQVNFGFSSIGNYFGKNNSKQRPLRNLSHQKSLVNQLMKSLPIDMFQSQHCKRDTLEGSSCSDRHSRWQPQEGSIPRQSNTCRIHRRSSRWCSLDRRSIYHKRQEGSRGMEEMEQVWEGFLLSLWDKMLPLRYHTCQWKH